MQCIDSQEMAPNHNLKRLIQAWQNNGKSKSCSSLPAAKHNAIVSLLKTIESTPFKVNSLKKLKSIMLKIGDEMKLDFTNQEVSSCALQVLIDIFDASKKSRLKAIEAGGVSNSDRAFA
ncbi:hypothetical protein ACH5RR_000696 [Cinchona calisaya]|uniref:Uncharacterized protein n=1 Tax=Cinchona calisaya TaxID=153742 RepID=A0ABD3B1C9_9GENT